MLCSLNTFVNSLTFDNKTLYKTWRPPTITLRKTEAQYTIYSTNGVWNSNATSSAGGYNNPANFVSDTWNEPSSLALTDFSKAFYVFIHLDWAGCNIPPHAYAGYALTIERASHISVNQNVDIIPSNNYGQNSESFLGTIEWASFTPSLVDQGYLYYRYIPYNTAHQTNDPGGFYGIDFLDAYSKSSRLSVVYDNLFEADEQFIIKLRGYVKGNRIGSPLNKPYNASRPRDGAGVDYGSFVGYAFERRLGYLDQVEVLNSPVLTSKTITITNTDISNNPINPVDYAIVGGTNYQNGYGTIGLPPDFDPSLRVWGSLTDDVSGDQYGYTSGVSDYEVGAVDAYSVGGWQYGGGPFSAQVAQVFDTGVYIPLNPFMAYHNGSRYQSMYTAFELNNIGMTTGSYFRWLRYDFIRPVPANRSILGLQIVMHHLSHRDFGGIGISSTRLPLNAWNAHERHSLGISTINSPYREKIVYKDTSTTPFIAAETVNSTPILLGGVPGGGGNSGEAQPFQWDGRSHIGITISYHSVENAVDGNGNTGLGASTVGLVRQTFTYGYDYQMNVNGTVDVRNRGSSYNYTNSTDGRLVVNVQTGPSTTNIDYDATNRFNVDFTPTTTSGILIFSGPYGRQLTIPARPIVQVGFFNLVAGNPPGYYL